jgi:hypothetical protein
MAVNLEVRVWSMTNQCVFCGKVALGLAFFQIICFLTCLYNSTSSPYLCFVHRPPTLYNGSIQMDKLTDKQT